MARAKVILVDADVIAHFIATGHIMELNGILSEHTGQPIDVIQKDTERDNFMTAEEAKEYGLIDEILTRPLPDETK